MNVLLLCNSFKSLSCSTANATTFSRSFSKWTTPLYFKITPSLYGEPLKKKKRIDPSIVKARDERRKKKLEKQIRRLEKNSRQLKPIDEMEIPLAILNENRSRTPPKLTTEQLDERVFITKAWAAYKTKAHIADIQMIDRIIFSQQRALDELQKESEELYQAAIQKEEGLLPYVVKGPVLTPPIKDFNAPDGDYSDISKKWD